MDFYNRLHIFLCIIFTSYLLLLKLDMDFYNSLHIDLYIQLELKMDIIIFSTFRNERNVSLLFWNQRSRTQTVALYFVRCRTTIFEAKLNFSGTDISRISKNDLSIFINIINLKSWPKNRFIWRKTSHAMFSL